MSELAVSSSLSDATIAVTVHGAAGVLDLVVPSGANSVDIAREYARQTDIAGIQHGSDVAESDPLLRLGKGGRGSIVEDSADQRRTGRLA